MLENKKEKLFKATLCKYIFVTIFSFSLNNEILNKQVSLTNPFKLNSQQSKETTFDEIS